MARPHKTTGAALSAAEKRKKIIDLRIGGASYRAIGEEVGCSHVYAFKTFKAHLDAVNSEARESVEDWRDLHIERLEAIIRQLMPLVIPEGGRPSPRTADDDADRGPSLFAVDRLVKLFDRQAKLLGLDKPAGLELSGPNGQPIPHSVEAAFEEVYRDDAGAKDNASAG